MQKLTNLQATLCVVLVYIFENNPLNELLFSILAKHYKQECLDN